MLIATGMWIVNLLADRPAWLGFISFLPVPVLLALVVVVCMDLIGDNRVVVGGVLIERKDAVNGYRLRLRPDGSELLRTFRMNLSFTNALSALQLDDRIEVRYYKLTRVVIAVHKAPPSPSDV